MMNGCICCTCGTHASNPHLAVRAPARLATQRARLALDRVRQDLVVVLNKLAKRQASGKLKLDGIIIETTGMADPAPVAQTFFVDDEVKAFSRLDGIVTLVAALVERFDRRGTESFELYRARSRLYRNEILQENMRLTAFFMLRVYKSCILLHPCNLKIFAKIGLKKQQFS